MVICLLSSCFYLPGMYQYTSICTAVDFSWVFAKSYGDCLMPWHKFPFMLLCKNPFYLENLQVQKRIFLMPPDKKKNHLTANLMFSVCGTT